MVAEARGVDVKINDLRIQSSTNGMSTAVDLVKNFQAIGLKAQTVPVPKGSNAVSGALCLVNYAGFNRTSVQDKNYTGWHWVVFLQQTETHVVVHDPDFWGARRNDGASKVYTITEWNKAFMPYPGNMSMTTVTLIE